VDHLESEPVQRRPRRYERAGKGDVCRRKAQPREVYAGLRGGVCCVNSEQQARTSCYALIRTQPRRRERSSVVIN
jgi:hypothetical protein